jgi:hypothetical protein
MAQLLSVLFWRVNTISDERRRVEVEGQAILLY